jgi:hypothetical protein
MARDRSSYAGLAAAAVFLAGWFIVGDASVRIVVLAVVAFYVALIVAQTASRRALVVAVAAAMCSALVAYKARSSQLTGQATYFNGRGRWGMGTELVTCEASPSKFRQAVKTTWEGSLFLALVGGGCFILHRKLRDVEDFP